MKTTMIILWGISFISLFLSIFWILLLLSEENRFKDSKKLTKYLKVSIIVPAHNQEKVIKKVIKSLLNLTYPKNKLEIIAVNDDSTDKTLARLRSIKDSRLKIINRHPGYTGKAAAVNAGLARAKGALIGILDGDTPKINKESLLYMISHFENPKIGAVIGSLKVWEPKNLLEKLQRIEYLIATLTRRLLATVNALYVTPGGSFSLFRKDVLDKVGPFDEKSLTEDLEIAMRLQYNHYDVKSEIKCITHTKVPNTIRAFHSQRVRWYRGWIHTLWKYRKMIFNKDYGFLGMFQMPVSVVIPLFLIAVTLIIGYHLLKLFYSAFLLLTSTTLATAVNNFILRESAISISPIYFPMLIVAFLGIYILSKAQIYLKESWKFPLATLGYIFVYQIILSAYWVVALTYEITRSDKRWDQ